MFNWCLYRLWVASLSMITRSYFASGRFNHLMVYGMYVHVWSFSWRGTNCLFILVLLHNRFLDEKKRSKISSELGWDFNMISRLPPPLTHLLMSKILFLKPIEESKSGLSEMSAIHLPSVSRQSLKMPLGLGTYLECGWFKKPVLWGWV